MRKFLYIYAIALIAGLGSCTAELKYIEYGVDIDFEIVPESIGATKLSAKATPAIDQTFYYWDVIECSELDNKSMSDEQFMMLKVDELYVDYLAWRHELLVKGEHYIANFQYHCLSYGPTSYFFSELKPETDYYLYGFCVNPETKDPMGELSKFKFTTQAQQSPDYRNPMTFDFEIHGNEVMVVPSTEGPSDYYIWGMLLSSDLKEYDMNIEPWSIDMVKMMVDSGILREMMCRGITKESESMAVGQEYIIAASAYDSNYEKTVYTKTFVYTGEPDFEVERSHDPMDWYHPGVVTGD
ncbi:MAG: hypothetical protein KBT05_05880 [Bacteroidales bacterium]|nr:hypothetical protein [Candidatus Cryptobacteroides caccocaballi]